MAATATGSQLTEQHRRAQVRLNGIVVTSILDLWPLLDLDRPTEPSGHRAWLLASLRVIQAQHVVSAALSRRYFQAFRTAEVGSPFAGELPRPAFDRQASTVGLMVNGPVVIERARRRGEQFTRANNVAQARVGAEAGRLALKGGRDTLIGAGRADRRLLGYARATSGNACAFCALIASRGPVFSEGSADFEAHRGCNCTPEPVYSRDSDWPAGSRKYAEIYAENARGSDDPLNAFRRALSADRG